MTEEILKLLRSGRSVVGVKQTIIAVETGKVECVLLAADADKRFKQRVTGICEKYRVPVLPAPPRASLGRECGIEVGAAVVGIRKA